MTAAPSRGRTFQDICHAEFTADFAQIARNTTLVLDHRGAADYFQIGNPTQVG